MKRCDRWIESGQEFTRGFSSTGELGCNNVPTNPYTKTAKRLENRESAVFEAAVRGEKTYGNPHVADIIAIFSIEDDNEKLHRRT